VDGGWKDIERYSYTSLGGLDKLRFRVARALWYLFEIATKDSAVLVAEEAFSLEAEVS
jgi:hypothetical protein